MTVAALDPHRRDTRAQRDCGYDDHRACWKSSCPRCGPKLREKFTQRGKDLKRGRR